MQISTTVLSEETEQLTINTRPQISALKYEQLLLRTDIAEMIYRAVLTHAPRRKYNGDKQEINLSSQRDLGEAYHFSFSYEEGHEQQHIGVHYTTTHMLLQRLGSALGYTGGDARKNAFARLQLQAGHLGVPHDPEWQRYDIPGKDERTKDPALRGHELRQRSDVARVLADLLDRHAPRKTSKDNEEKIYFSSTLDVDLSFTLEKEEGVCIPFYFTQVKKLSVALAQALGYDRSSIHHTKQFLKPYLRAEHI